MKKTNNLTEKLFLGVAALASGLLLTCLSITSYAQAPLVSTVMGPTDQASNSVQGKTNGTYSTSTFSKPCYLAFSGDSLFIAEEKTESSGVYTYAPTIRVATNNQLSTIIDGTVSTLTIDRLKAIDFSLDGDTMFLANDKNSLGPISFGKMTKGTSGYENPINIWDDESVTALAVHPTTGDVLFVGYSDNSWIYRYSVATGKVDKVGQLTATAGGTVVKKPSASSIVFDKKSKSVYFIAKGKHIIFKGQYDPVTAILSDVHIFAGQEGTGGYADGNGTAALFNEPCQGAIGGDGNLYVADRKNHRIRKVATDGTVTTYTGSGTSGQTDGSLNDANFNHPQGLAFGPDGAMYIADYWNHRIRKIVDATLPVTLTTFTAKPQGNRVVLNWTTASEKNNSHFIIKKSNDGANFTELLRVSAKSVNGAKYQSFDLNPLSGNNYYQLLQVDRDGTIQDLGVKNVKLYLQTSVQIYPNPVVDKLYITANQNDFTMAHIYNTNGKLVLTCSLKDDFMINVSSLVKGAYTLQLSGERKEVRKFIKQ